MPRQRHRDAHTHSTRAQHTRAAHPRAHAHAISCRFHLCAHPPFCSCLAPCQWNLRALAAVFQGLSNTSPATYKKPELFGRLYMHEATRVYSDRMVLISDCEAFKEIIDKNANEVRWSW